MPIKPTSENPENKFWTSPGPNVLNNRRQILALTVYACVGFIAVLILYHLRGGDPFNRVAFAFFVSALPALGALAFLRLTKLLVSWQGAATLYFLMLFLILIIQNFGRMVPVYN
jgi:hypothetical protein